MVHGCRIVIPRAVPHSIRNFSSFIIIIFSWKVMEMEEIPELNLGGSSSCEALESEQKNMGAQRISVSDHVNVYQYSAKEADSFVIDMDSISSGINKDSTNANSRLTLQRSLSRKGSQRGGDRKVNGNVTLHDRDTAPTTYSPKAALAGSCTAEKSAVLAVGSTHHSTNTQVHHQIAITASNMCSSTPTESKCVTRRNSFKRSSSWLLDPKRVLLFFATLSSMGTMLLIYFTLTISKQNADEYEGDWQQ
ncbi:hypothetical protein E2542_SST22610 [Spatholobus suberectus]|nr:hypothetical protein E2542_SST22605 [Spatholobus suberectus]TKY51100.1 hypothetical protein E2542_SST22610 [Spatholobus suberectus]